MFIIKIQKEGYPLHYVEDYHLGHIHLSEHKGNAKRYLSEKTVKMDRLSIILDYRLLKSTVVIEPLNEEDIDVTETSQISQKQRWPNLLYALGFGRNPPKI